LSRRATGLVGIGRLPHAGCFYPSWHDAPVPRLVLDAVKVPVIASGGMADARGIAAAFTLGAATVQIGTAHLLCPQAKSSTVHRQALRLGDAKDNLTVVMSDRRQKHSRCSNCCAAMCRTAVLVRVLAPGTYKRPSPKWCRDMSDGLGFLVSRPYPLSPGALFWMLTLARPKSRILARPYSVTKILAGLMSRWMMPFA
jgi:hypothetical protein